MTAGATASLVVESVVGLVLVQDLGRPGRASLGVVPSGAFDVGAHRAANAAVGNAAGAATLELLLGPLVLRATRACVLAVTGAPGPVLVGDLAVLPGRAFTLLPGMTVTVGAAVDGVRRYVAVRGGVDVPAVLGSRSRDTLAEIGPEPLAAGDTVAVGRLAEAGAWRGGRAADQPPPPDRAARATGPGGAVVLRVLPGPRPEYFADGALEALRAADYTVTDRCDRVAVRLGGAPVPRSEGDGEAPTELPSEGLVVGAVQVPPSGQPVVMGPDHPLTGGYPVLAVLTRASVAELAQLRPGARVRLVVAEES